MDTFRTGKLLDLEQAQVFLSDFCFEAKNHFDRANHHIREFMKKEVRKVSKKRRLIFSISVSVFLIIVFISIIIGCIYIYNKYFKIDDEVYYSVSPLEKYEYRFLEHDFDNDDVSVGFVTIFKELKGEEFLSYIEEDGNHVLISQAGTREYRCEASCVCENNRKSSGLTVVQSGLIFLVAATSSLVAHNIAKEHFDGVCKTMGSKKDKWIDDEGLDCLGTKWKTMVDKCDGYDWTEEEWEKNDFAVGKRRYMCHGHCYPRKLRHPRAQDMAEDLNCIEIQYEGEIFMDAKETGARPFDGHMRSLVSLKFQEEVLHPFCEETTIASYHYVTKGKQNQISIKVPLCQGRKTRFYDFMNPTIMCRQIYEDGTSDPTF